MHATLPAPARVQLRVLDVLGRLVLSEEWADGAGPFVARIPVAGWALGYRWSASVLTTPPLPNA
ncbi:hypothetical protein EJV47_19440 [Hymenobacter gummosus]|uniref:Uncharacterized protein n=1 Tax=Hymenobacter gummosus TaxID=1776032 RepID=A0A3S0HLC1_9BACT|nr:hypothetical protein [Hymenobacter gummosus]RTQ47590.1 hypothetical protein EJV47_19440 [Hymenobacter gummosus]